MNPPRGHHEDLLTEAAVPESPPGASGSLWFLVASDEEPVREFVRAESARLGARLRTAASAAQALAVFDRQAIDLVVVDLAAPGIGGIELIKRLREDHPETAVVALAEYGSDSAAREALAAGAAETIGRPFEEEDWRAKLGRLARTLSLDRENRVLREQLGARPGFGMLVGLSPRVQEVYRRIEKASRSDSPVLVLGETGTGKELVARSIHFHSPRRQGPFVPVDCAGVVPTLVESELFGYVKGAFTGAFQTKRGLIEAASGGTLFLDEIGELPKEMQAKLLRALQEREVRPVGSTATVRVDIRVVAATHRDLEGEVARGTFRQDLFYRLNVLPIRLPPLRERKSDIPLLVSHLLERMAAEGRPAAAFSEEALERLVAYDWPGNVRELENAVARALALNSGPILHLGDLPTNLQGPPSARAAFPPPAPSHPASRPESRPEVSGFGTSPPDSSAPSSSAEENFTLAELERRAVYGALRKTGGDKVAAARLLGIGKTTLYRKLKEYGQPQDSPESSAASDPVPNPETSGRDSGRDSA